MPQGEDASTDGSPDSDPICGTNQPFCDEVPFIAVPGASDCDVRAYVDPPERCSCDCATDRVGCGAHGRCIRRGQRPPECECDLDGRHVGAHCDQCAAGLSGPDCSEGCWSGTFPTNAGCKTLCELADVACSSEGGTCADTTPARCICRTGWAEPDCSTCAAGYHQDLLLFESSGVGYLCTPDCDDCPCGSCAPSRRCDQRLRPPACVCRSAYSEVDGQCVWHGMDLRLPTSTASCGDWRFFVMPPRSEGVPDQLSVAAIDGQLVFHAEGCGAVAAGTMVELPASDTMPGAAIYIRYAGTLREPVGVYLGGSLDEEPSQRTKSSWTLATSLEAVASGEQYTWLCLPKWAAGERTGLLFWVTNTNDCRVPVDFTISELSLVASTWCND
jgi:hypothetical protein